MALAVILAVAPASSMPAEATDWSNQIAATRASQVAYESSMRAADQQIRSLKGAGKHAHRRLKASHRHVRAARQRLAEVRSRRTATHVEMDDARADLAAAMKASPPWTDLIDLRRVISSLPFLEPVVPASLLASGGADGDPIASDGALVAQSGAQVLELERAARQQTRAVAKAARHLRRSVHSQRSRVHTVRSIRASQRAALSRRAGAEAGLGWAILAMSDLAQRRVDEKTAVRPGQTSAFAWPTYGRITQSYGCTGFYLNPARGSCPHFHDGLDISGSLGTPIRSAAVGVVSYIGWNPWDGRQRAFIIVVAHPGGYETLYGHVLPTREVRVGQLVRKGQLIGSMGSTGRSAGVHLHLELRRGRITSDPLGFL